MGDINIQNLSQVARQALLDNMSKDANAFSYDSSGNPSVVAGKTFSSTDADGLLAASTIVPQRVVASVNVPGTAAATAGNYPVFFVADAAYQVVSVQERHETAGADAGAVTVMLKKVPSGTAKASGTDTLSAGINLKATADTNQSGALHATVANYQLAAGDSLALVTTGTLTSVAGVTVSVELKRI